MSVGGLREEKFKGQARRTSLFQLPTAKNSPADENASELTESLGASDTSTSFSPAAPIPIPIEFVALFAARLVAGDPNAAPALAAPVPTPPPKPELEPDAAFEPPKSAIARGRRLGECCWVVG